MTHFNNMTNCVLQVLRLTQKEQLLGERLESACQENTELRASLASLRARLARHDQLNQQHAQQVHAIQIRDPVVLKRSRPPCKAWRIGAHVNKQAFGGGWKFLLKFRPSCGTQPSRDPSRDSLVLLDSSHFFKFHTRSEPWNLALQGVFLVCNSCPFLVIASVSSSSTRCQISPGLHLPLFRSSHFMFDVFAARPGLAGGRSRKESHAAAAGTGREPPGKGVGAGGREPWRRFPAVRAGGQPGGSRPGSQ